MPEKSYMRSTYAAKSKSVARSHKAPSEYPEDDEDMGSEHLFKIDTALVKHNRVNISMHQTNNSSRRGSRTRGDKLITLEKKDSSRASSKRRATEPEEKHKSFITVVGGNMALN